MIHEIQFLRAQTRIRTGAVASPRCAAKTGRLFIQIEWATETPPTAFERLQAYVQKRNEWEQMS